MTSRVEILFHDRMERDLGGWTGEDAASALSWWADAGVDVFVAEEPRNWLQPRPPSTRVAEPPPKPSTPELPQQLPLFRAWLAEAEKLPFAAPGTRRLCPEGDPASGLMILIDMPAAEDCRAGQLVSGDAGKLLDRMLAAIGRDRASVYIAALSCIRSPTGSFDPTSAGACADLARHHIALAEPRAVLLFGDACARALLGRAVAPSRAAWREIGTPRGAFKAVATFSPDFLLRNPTAKAQAWADLQLLMEGL